MDTSPGTSANVFHNQLEANLPRLRRHGLALTRNHHAMEDLVQETVMRALAAEASFEPGTNFGGWIDRLPRGQRDALLMSALSDLNYAQIAAVLACRTGTVKSRISRSRSRLRDALIGVAAGDKNGAA